METPEPVPVLTPVPDNGLGLRRHALVCLLSILLSILLHCGAMVALEHVSMHGPAMAETNRPTQPELPPMRIETFAREAGLNTPPAIAEPDITEAARRSAQTTAAKAEALPAPTPLPPGLPPEPTPPTPPPPPTPTKSPGLTLPRQAIAAVPDLPFLHKRNPEPRWEIPASIPRMPQAPDLAESVRDLPIGGMSALPRPDVSGATDLAAAVASLGGPTGGKEAPSEPPPALPDDAARAVAVSALAQAAAVTPTAQAPDFRPIDDRLSLALTVSEPADDPNFRYFRLEIVRRPESSLPVMPKDVVLIQDVSGSIGAERLAQGKAALKAALANVLRSGDRFNVFAFRDVTLTPSNAWLTYDPTTRARAETFIDSLRAIGNTDLFLLLQDLLTLPRAKDRPMIAVVVTDGEPTVGVTGTTRIIGEFTRMNQGQIAVYTFGTKKRDPYFLDMLCYANRGENTTTSGTAASLATELAPVFDSIRNPVMKDLTLTFDAKSGGEIHPHALTHLYADRPLVVYGRVPKATRGVTCQLKGFADGAPYDAVFAFDFAEAARSPHDLRRAWATRAMFDLLADYAANPSPAILGKIETFSRTYGVPNPYRRD